MCADTLCAYPLVSDVCPLCYRPSYQELLAQRAHLAAEIHRGCTGREEEYTAIQAEIAARSGTNLHQSCIARRTL